MSDPQRLAMPPTVEHRHIQWRIDGNPASNDSVRVVPYLEAWVCAHYLDRWVGPACWRDSYEPTGKTGVMWCHIDVRDLSGEWVRHTDVGTASQFEADKGLISDAFKRCASRKWGIGWNVFELPGPLWLPQGKYRSYQAGGKTVAVLTDQSQAEILRQLVAQGVDVTARDVAVDHTATDHSDDVAQAANTPPTSATPALPAATASTGYPGDDTDRKGVDRERRDLISSITDLSAWRVTHDADYTTDHHDTLTRRARDASTPLDKLHEWATKSRARRAALEEQTPAEPAGRQVDWQAACDAAGTTTGLAMTIAQQHADSIADLDRPDSLDDVQDARLVDHLLTWLDSQHGTPF